MLFLIILSWIIIALTFCFLKYCYVIEIARIRIKRKFDNISILRNSEKIKRNYLTLLFTKKDVRYKHDKKIKGLEIQRKIAIKLVRSNFHHLRGTKTKMTRFISVKCQAQAT